MGKLNKFVVCKSQWLLLLGFKIAYSATYPPTLLKNLLAFPAFSLFCLIFRVSMDLLLPCGHCASRPLLMVSPPSNEKYNRYRPGWQLRRSSSPIDSRQSSFCRPQNLKKDSCNRGQVLKKTSISVPKLSVKQLQSNLCAGVGLRFDSQLLPLLLLFTAASQPHLWEQILLLMCFMCVGQVKTWCLLGGLLIRLAINSNTFQELCVNLILEYTHDVTTTLTTLGEYFKLILRIWVLCCLFWH